VTAATAGRPAGTIRPPVDVLQDPAELPLPPAARKSTGAEIRAWLGCRQRRRQRERVK